MSPERLAEAASARIAAWAAGLDGPLRATFDALCAGSGRAADRGARAYLDPGSPPLLVLPLWLRGDLPDDAVVDLGASALAGYLHVRVLDDRFDEDKGDPDLSLALASALHAAHHAWAGRVVTDPRYWELHLHRWTRFNLAMVEERGLLRGVGHWDAETFDRILDRSRPLVLPGAAALAARGRWDLLGPLVAWGDAVVAAHQRFEDLRDASTDFAAGRTTWVLARAAPERPQDLAGWLLRGGMDEEIAAATDALRAACDAARALDAPHAIAWADSRMQTMEAWKRGLVERILTQALKPR